MANEESNPQYETLDEIVEAMMTMDDDPLAQDGTAMVICRGNPESKLMIVGEAPGPQENKQGKPFVGPSGKLLDQILESVGFDSNKDVFITNSVYRMPKGDGGKAFRKPKVGEMEFYKPYLLNIIDIIDPQIMLLTGAVSLRSVLDEKKQGITKVRGQWFERDGRWIMPIFHPSYLLRNPEKTPGSPKALMWDDIKEVRRKYDELGLG